MTRNTGQAQCAHTADPCNKVVRYVYRLINAGRLDACKIDHKTVITHESICRYIKVLPKAGKSV